MFAGNFTGDEYENITKLHKVQQERLSPPYTSTKYTQKQMRLQ